MKNVLISCATSGMGSEIARALSVDTNLVLAARNQDKLARLGSDLKSTQTSSTIHTLPLDFFDSESVDNCTSMVSEALDGIVFIIPRIQASTVVFPDDQEWQELYSNYFIKPLRLLKNLVESGKLNRGCKIVMISGISSKSALSHYAQNNCLRSAWVGQAKTMALALGEQGISVNTISLGGVMTNSYTEKMQNKAKDQNLSFDDLMKNEVSNVPLRKYASVDNVVATVTALLGPMADHLTGQNLMLDGGFFKGY